MRWEKSIRYSPEVQECWAELNSGRPLVKIMKGRCKNAPTSLLRPSQSMPPLIVSVFQLFASSPKYLQSC